MSTRPSSPSTLAHPARTPHRANQGAAPLPFAARAAATVAGLRIDPDGHLTEVAVPLRATTWSLAAFTDTVWPTGVQALTLDRELLCWTREPDAGRYNPLASAVAAMFGCPGDIHGPVVFTGWAPADAGTPVGRVDHIGVAAVILVAGTAASCDVSDRTAQRAAEFALLDVHIAGPRAAGHDRGGGPRRLGRESYDAQRHTVTREGGWPRCAGCGEIIALGHEEHHPGPGPADAGP